MKTYTALLFLIAPAAAVFGQEKPFAVDRGYLDTTCKPCEDFWRYANGTWIDKNPIPARYPSWSTMAALGEKNRDRIRTILEAAAANQSAGPGSNQRKIGDYYAACMDTAAIDARGLEPLKRELDRVSGIGSRAALVEAITEFQTLGRIGPFAVFSGQDYRNSSEVIAQLSPAAISLPERDYYFKDDPRMQKIREEFVKHVARMFELAGDPAETAAAGAKTVMAFETALAEPMLTNVARRDPYARYHRMDVAGVAALVPAFEWKAVLRKLDIAENTPINVAEPEFMKTLNQKLASAPVEDWKNWLRWRLLDGSARLLAKPLRDEDFNFSETVLRGVKEQQPRWEVCSEAVDRSLGEALGPVFVERYFPPDAKKRANELVENLRVTLRQELEGADWLAPETRKSAVLKLNAFVAKIGYPDKWRDYSEVTLDRAKYYESARSAGLVNRKYNLAKIGKPVDRTEWGMTPPTVNAYYSPLKNEIAFPAGILQPPFFDMTADDAINYGAIGAVIGHEMGHGFDDQGSKFDAEGNLKNWWTEADRKKFDERAACVINQFNTLDVGDGLRHNGKLVVGEGMGDLGGLTLAYKAYKRSLRGKPEPLLIEGFTADQRFFLAFARVWAGQHRPEAMRLRLNTDPHPLYKFRANGTLQNMPEFREAFGCKLGDAMVRAPEKQCKLW